MRYLTGHGAYELTEFPGCRRAVISHGFRIAKAHRGRGFGTIDHQTHLDTARLLGYDYVVCTVRATNVPERRILSRAGWRKLDEFTNSRTGNRLCVYGRSLAAEKGGLR